MFSRKRIGFSFLCGSALVLRSTAAWALDEVKFTVDGLCPSSAEVASQLARVLPQVARTAVSKDADVKVVNEGDEYRVLVRESERLFVDPSRSCEERARTAAAFIAITLMPPNIAAPEVSFPEARGQKMVPNPEEKPASETRAPMPTTDAIRLRALTAYSGVHASFADSERGGYAAPFVGADATGGFRYWQLGVSAFVALPGEFETHRVNVETTRWGATAFLRWEILHRSLARVALDLGPAVVIDSLNSRVSNARSDTAVQVGLRASVVPRLKIAGIFGLAAPVQVLYLPNPPELRLHQAGSLGTVSPISFSAGLGPSFEFY